MIQNTLVEIASAATPRENFLVGDVKNQATILDRPNPFRFASTLAEKKLSEGDSSSQT